MSKTQAPWIIKGYETFAIEGPLGLKVERLAKAVGKHKSSFYHHFAELDIFIAVLLETHLHHASIMAKEEAAGTTLEEFIDVLVAHKTDLLFNRHRRRLFRPGIFSGHYGANHRACPLNPRHHQLAA
ncbi:MAG: AcrR family transcriptional regulator [Neolewinella sp.]|jgi:AcrR family transcriptional regulator